MTFTKILCPTDFSAGSEQAIKVAIRLANETNAALVLVHSWYIPAIAFSIEAPYPPFFLQEITDQAQQDLDKAVRDAAASGAKNVSGHLVNGPPASTIVALLEKDAFDLCVIGTHGRTGLARVVLGSVAENVIRHSPCSVLAVRPDSSSEPFRNVLVPTDFSDSANKAAQLANQLVTRDGQITLLHVLEVPVMYSGQVVVTDIAQTLDAHAAAALAATAKRITDVRVTTQTRMGYPGAQTIAALDLDPGIDLVVMGSHGRTGIRRALLGSVAEKVVRHAHCPVLVARAV